MRRISPALFSFILFFSFGGFVSLTAQEGRTAQGLRDDPLVLKLAVIGPGDELYFWWGHIGLIIEDTRTQRARFYDWGIFSFDNENFFVNFALGRLIYCCGVSRPEWSLGHYVETNRDITLYTLNLPPEKKWEVLQYAEWSVLPENRDYFYHHFKDNCATRIRDIIDMATDGQFKGKYGDMDGQFTLRQQVRRHTWFSPFIDWSLNFLMGQDIDTLDTVWQDMFLPSEIGTRISEFSYTMPNGAETKLVNSVEIVNRSENRPQVLEKPRTQWPRELLFSLVFSSLAVLSYVIWGKRDCFKVYWGSLHSALGLFFGLMGTVLFFMTFFTDHDYTYHNSNVIFVNPLLLAAVPLGFVYAFTKTARKRFISACLLLAVWNVVLLGGLLSMVIKLSPAFYQQNQVTQALLLPIALTINLITAKLNLLKRNLPTA